MQVRVQQHVIVVRPSCAEGGPQGEPGQAGGRHLVDEIVQPGKQPGMRPEGPRPAADRVKHGRADGALHHDVGPGDVEDLGHRDAARPGVRHHLGFRGYPAGVPPVAVPPQHPPVADVIHIRVTPRPDERPRHLDGHAPEFVTAVTRPP
ncbi:MAG TPA: hypothetical protein VF838_10410 [Trebonia sp.]